MRESRRAFLEGAAAAAVGLLASELPAQEDVKRFRGRDLKETSIKGVTIRYFLEIFTVGLAQLSAVHIEVKGTDTARFVEFMGEESGLAAAGSYIRCDVTLFDEGDKEKWIYRRSGGAWVAHRVFHPSRRAKVRAGPRERLLENTPAGEVILEAALPQFPGPEDYVKWMAVSVAQAKEPEQPLGQFLPMIKHITVTE